VVAEAAIILAQLLPRDGEAHGGCGQLEIDRAAAFAPSLRVREVFAARVERIADGNGMIEADLRPADDHHVRIGEDAVDVVNGVGIVKVLEGVVRPSQRIGAEEVGRAVEGDGEGGLPGHFVGDGGIGNDLESPGQRRRRNQGRNQRWNQDGVNK